MRLGSWSEIGGQKYSINPICQAIFLNFLSAHFFIFLTVLTALSRGFDKWWYELENSRTMSKLEQNSWKLPYKKFKPLSHCILLGMPNLKKIFKNARIILSAVWSTRGSMHTNLEYLLTTVKNIFPWNSKDHRPVCPKVWHILNHSSNFQMVVWLRIYCKFHSYCIVAWYLHLFQARRHRI